MNIDSIKERLLNRGTSSNPVIKACMMGGKGVGKSSVLTSLYKNVDTAVNGTQLYFEPTGQTALTLSAKYQELMDMFADDSKQKGIPNAGIAGDFSVNTYNFVFGMKNTRNKMDVNIKDFPGEFIEKEPDVVRSFVEESQCVIVAIDTPHLMEEGGAFNEAKNCCKRITDFFISNPEAFSSHKLILLVPLKCEKYYYDGRIAEVSRRTSEVYSELIGFVKENHPTDVAISILPIITVGGVVFSGFQRKHGEVVTVQKADTSLRLPGYVDYAFKNEDAVYSPKYCEQPICYMLTFLAKEYNDLQQKRDESTIWKRFLNHIKDIFNIFSDNPEFLLEVLKLKRKRIVNNPELGYTIETGKNLI